MGIKHTRFKNDYKFDEIHCLKACSVVKSYFRRKRKNGQKMKKKASRKAGTVENARLFRQLDNLRCKFQKNVLGGTLALVLHFQETDRLNLPCFWILTK
jgi:hypothetical protein